MLTLRVNRKFAPEEGLNADLQRKGASPPVQCYAVPAIWSVESNVFHWPANMNRMRSDSRVRVLPPTRVTQRQIPSERTRPTNARTS